MEPLPNLKRLSCNISALRWSISTRCTLKQPLWWVAANPTICLHHSCTDSISIRGWYCAEIGIQKNRVKYVKLIKLSITTVKSSKIFQQHIYNATFANGSSMNCCYLTMTSSFHGPTCACRRGSGACRLRRSNGAKGITFFLSQIMDLLGIQMSFQDKYCKYMLLLSDWDSKFQNPCSQDLYRSGMACWIRTKTWQRPQSEDFGWHAQLEVLYITIVAGTTPLNLVHSHPSDVATLYSCTHSPALVPSSAGKHLCLPLWQNHAVVGSTSCWHNAKVTAIRSHLATSTKSCSDNPGAKTSLQ